MSMGGSRELPFVDERGQVVRDRRESSEVRDAAMSECWLTGDRADMSWMGFYMEYSD